MLPKRLQRTLHRIESCSMWSEYFWDNISQEKTQCNVVWITSPFGDFYYGPVNFFIITSSCKCSAIIAQVSPTLHKKNLGRTVTKKKRLYVMCYHFTGFIMKHNVHVRYLFVSCLLPLIPNYTIYPWFMSFNIKTSQAMRFFKLQFIWYQWNLHSMLKKFFSLILFL